MTANLLSADPNVTTKGGHRLLMRNPEFVHFMEEKATPTLARAFPILSPAEHEKQAGRIVSIFQLKIMKKYNMGLVH